MSFKIFLWLPIAVESKSAEDTYMDKDAKTEIKKQPSKTQGIF